MNFLFINLILLIFAAISIFFLAKFEKKKIKNPKLILIEEILKPKSIESIKKDSIIPKWPLLIVIPLVVYIIIYIFIFYTIRDITFIFALFSSVSLGIISNYFFELFMSRKENNVQIFDRFKFIAPLFVAPLITYLSFKTGDNINKFFSLGLAFEHGFVWRIILSKMNITVPS